MQPREDVQHRLRQRGLARALQQVRAALHGRDAEAALRGVPDVRVGEERARRPAHAVPEQLQQPHESRLVLKLARGFEAAGSRCRNDAAEGRLGVGHVACAVQASHHLPVDGLVRPRRFGRHKPVEEELVDGAESHARDNTTETRRLDGLQHNAEASPPQRGSPRIVSDDNIEKRGEVHDGVHVSQVAERLQTLVQALEPTQQRRLELERDLLAEAGVGCPALVGTHSCHAAMDLALDDGHAIWMALVHGAGHTARHASKTGAVNQIRAGAQHKTSKQSKKDRIDV